MPIEKLTTIRLPMPFGMGFVNCYLVRAVGGFILVDTGGANNRKQLARELENAGCRPGDLRLVVITHGDFDHTGNAAYVRGAFGVKTAMHAGDARMAESGDMFAGRKKPNILIRLLIPLFTGFGKAERFSPDLLLEDGDNLAQYGVEARIVAIPGHSSGSIAILTAAGDLFCGDLLESTKEPAFNALMDDPRAGQASLQKLRGFKSRHHLPRPRQTVFTG